MIGSCRLQNLGVAGRRDDLLERVPGSRRRSAHLAADIGKLRGGCVRDLILADNRRGDFLLEEFVGVQSIEEIVDGRLAHGVVREVATHQARALEDVGDLQQLPCVERTAEVGTGQRRAHVPHPVEGRAAAHDHHGFRRRSLGQAMLHLALRNGRRQLPCQLLGRLAHRLGGKHVQNRRKFQRVQGFFKKAHLLSPICV